MKALTTTMLLASALALAACQPAADPEAARVAEAAKAEATERAAAEMAEQFNAQFEQQNWELARAHGDVLLAQYPDSAAAAQIAERHAEAIAKVEEVRESRRTAALWAYQTEAVDGGSQLSAAIYSKDPVDVGDGAAQPVRLIFRDHPQWGDSSYLVLASGDFDCYRGCKVQVAVDEGAPKPMAASRPKTDDAIAMFIEDERALWRIVGDAERIAVEFPVKAGGTRTAVFEVAGLDPARLPDWK